MNPIHRRIPFHQGGKSLLNDPADTAQGVAPLQGMHHRQGMDDITE
jgi:hypothetical protein